MKNHATPCRGWGGQVQPFFRLICRYCFRNNSLDMFERFPANLWLHLQTIQKFLKIHVFTNDIQSEYPFQMFKYLTNCVGIYTVCLISNFKCAKWSKHFTLHNSKDISYNNSMLINVWCNPTCTVRNKNHLTSVTLN